MRRRVIAGAAAAVNALHKGMALLRGGTMDDDADRVRRALDRPDLIRRMTAEQQAMLSSRAWERQALPLERG